MGGDSAGNCRGTVVGSLFSWRPVGRNAVVPERCQPWSSHGLSDCQSMEFLVHDFNSVELGWAQVDFGGSRLVFRGGDHFWGDLR